jgi:hypothetical protein
MNNKNRPGRIASILLGAVLALAPVLEARTCGGAGDVVGSFGWSGGRAMAFVSTSAVTTPTTTPTTTAPAVSPTPIGALLSGAGGTGAFASVGRVYLDGNGGVFASSAPGDALMSVGTYSVNGDCTISMTLSDTFATPAPMALVTTTAPVGVTYQGVLVQNGNEIDLTQTGNAATSSLTMTKTQQSCTTGYVFSAFGIAASGSSTAVMQSSTGTTGTTTTTPTTSTTPAAPTPFNIVGRFVADGSGNLITDNFGEASPLTSREITGSYTVNADCTGTATLITSDGVKRAANFVIVTQGPNLTTGTQALQFAFSGNGVTGTGLAQQQ